MQELVAGYKDVVANVKAYNEGSEQGDSLQGQMSYFRAWYFIPELGMVGPSKFVGYKGMTAEKYASSDDLDGKDTEPILTKWFRVLEKGTPEAEYVEQVVRSLLAKNGKKLNRIARFNAPIGWKLDKESAGVIVPEVPKESALSPMGELYWRAYLTLYPEDQQALAKRINEHNK